jgi:LuxR family transcriptional regulator, regulator of acetate metabolism
MTATESATNARPEVFSGPLGEQLHKRFESATADARELLGLPADAGEGVTDLDQLRALIDALSAQLSDDELAAPPIEDRQGALERLRHRFETRFEALDRVQVAIAELREVTAPREMLARAPAVLCAGSAFQRAILSLVKGGRMVAETAHFSGQDRAAATTLAQLQASPLRLEHTLIETELLRRRRATIVVDADVHPRVDRETARLMGWRSYAAAPLVVGSQVVGVIHADRGPGQPLDVLDRDVLWEFATALAQAYESASLARTLRGEREQMRSFLEWLSARSSDLTDAPIRLATVRRPPRPPLAPLETPGALGRRDDRAVFEGLLTRRELDVLRLLADGKTNKAIAEALVISDGTVKFHVNSILRKLHVANRAEAVSRYLRLLGMRAP